MDQFTIEIAQAAIGVVCGFGSTKEYCRRYLTEREPEAAVTVSPEELRQEQALLDEEADREGLRRRVFTDPFLERAVIQRKTAQFLLSRNVLLLHGSTVAVDGSGYLFTAKTGVGKSTHTRLWRELFGSRAQMVNDDRTFLRFTEDAVLACGSPWSGKHGLDTNLTVPLAGICFLHRGSENRISPAAPADSLPALLEQAFFPEESSAADVTRLTELLSRRVPLWTMQCTKELEAAEVAFEAMASRNIKR